MAIVTYIEKDGQRIDVTGIEPVSEWRCDGCGEFLDEAARATLDINIEVGSLGSISGHIDAHTSHLAQAIEKVAPGLIAQVVPF